MTLQKALPLLLLLAQSLPAHGEGFSKSETAESWALKQMQHMLADRPVMKTYLVGGQTLWVRQQDSIWQWVAEHYAGKTTRFWTAWHEASPVEIASAMHSYGNDKAYLYIKDLAAPALEDHNKSFETLWSSAVFELFNLENAQGFGLVHKQSCEGKNTRVEYARKFAELEHLALGKKQQFYREIWLPWCEATGFVSDPMIWQRNYLPSFDKWLAQYPPDGVYPWEYYGKWYDLTIQQPREDARQKEAAKATAK